MLLAERELIARALERTIADKNTEAEAAARRCLDWLDAEICNAGIEC
ncbi:MAG: hypothetical protein ACREMY_15715 [bacterium]